MIALALLLAAVASGIASAAASTPASAQTLTVLAAASLAEPFRELGVRFEKAHPGTTVRFAFAGSQQLAAQLDQGLAADVFASADERWMAHAIARGTVTGPGTIFATNRLVAIVPKANPGRIGGLEDLARPGLKIVIGAESVPVGAYTRRALAHLSADPALGGAFATNVLRNVVSNEENVKHVLGKVQLGEADAGFVYRSDVTAKARRHVREIALPGDGGVEPRYPVAVAAASRQPERARAFVALLASPEGQAILARHGLGPGPTP